MASWNDLQPVLLGRIRKAGGMSSHLLVMNANQVVSNLHGPENLLRTQVTPLHHPNDNSKATRGRKRSHELCSLYVVCALVLPFPCSKGL